MRKKLKRAAVIFELGVVLIGSMAGCSGKGNIESDVSNVQGVDRPTGTGISSDAQDSGAAGDSGDAAGSNDTGTVDGGEKNTESILFDGADLNGRVVEFSDTGFAITPVHTTVYEDGTTSSWEAAPGYEKEEDNINITYAENAVFEIVYFSMSQQIETLREDGDKSDVKKETMVYIFGSCQDEKNWTADKVLIQRWVD